MNSVGAFETAGKVVPHHTPDFSVLKGDVNTLGNINFA